MSLNWFSEKCDRILEMVMGCDFSWGKSFDVCEFDWKWILLLLVLVLPQTLLLERWFHAIELIFWEMWSYFGNCKVFLLIWISQVFLYRKVCLQCTTTISKRKMIIFFSHWSIKDFLTSTISRELMCRYSSCVSSFGYVWNMSYYIMINMNAYKFKNIKFFFPMNKRIVLSIDTKNITTYCLLWSHSSSHQIEFM